MNEFSNAGIKIKYAVEATAGTRPTTNYTVIPGIKGTPDFNPAPSTIDVTDLSDTEFRRYIAGLKDTGGASAFRANITADFKTAWDELVEAAQTAFASGKATWLEIAIPNFDSFYVSGMPSPLGLSAQDVGNAFEGDVYFTPNTIHGFDDASTTSP